MALSLFTAAAEEPVSLSEAKLHLRVDVSDEDTLISSLITAGREAAENFTNRSLVAQTWDWTPTTSEFAPFVSGLPLDVPKPPLSTVTHIKYLDPDGVETTFSSSDYIVSAPDEGNGQIALDDGAEWPETQDVINNVRIRFVSGFGDADDVPEALKVAIKEIVGNLFANRESVIVTGRGQAVVELPQSAVWLMMPYREVSF